MREGEAGTLALQELLRSLLDQIGESVVRLKVIGKRMWGLYVKRKGCGGAGLPV
jgi:hypothetical protein